MLWEEKRAQGLNYGVKIINIWHGWFWIFFFEEGGMKVIYTFFCNDWQFCYVISFSCNKITLISLQKYFKQICRSNIDFFKVSPNFHINFRNSLYCSKFFSTNFQIEKVSLKIKIRMSILNFFNFHNHSDSWIFH